MAFRIARNVTITEPTSHAFTINVTQSKSPHGVGPLGVHFDAITGSDFDGNTDPAKTLSFWWDFGDDGAVFTNAGKAGEAFGTDANIAQGPWVAHVYPENNTGSDVTYTGYVYVYDHISGKSGIQSFTVTVVDSDTFFAGTNTIVVSQSGDFTGAPAGAQQITDVRAIFDSGTFNNGSKRVLLRAGEQFLFSTDNGGATELLNLRADGFVLIGKFGTGSNPVINSDSTDGGEWKDLFWLRENSEVTISEVDFIGNYDAETGQGWSARSRVLYPQDSASCTLYSCSVSGFGYAISSASEGGLAFVFDTKIRDWAGFAVFTQEKQKLSVIGSSIRQNLNAVSGPDEKQSSSLPIWADHGPIRIAISEKSYVAKNDLFNNAGWSSGGLAHQPCIRYQTSTSDPTENVGHSGNMNQNVMEGGYIVALLETANGSITHELGTPIFESNQLIATNNTIHLISTGFANSVIRNNYGFRGDFPNDGNLQNFKSFIATDGTKSSSSDNLANDIIATGNTVITVQSDPSSGDFNLIDNEAGLNFVDSQNLVYAPSVPNSSDFTDYSPLDTNNYYAPLPTSAAYEGGTKTQYLWDTFDGELRDSPNNNIGAMSSELASTSPTANAGPDLNADNGETITLSGATANDYDSLQWTCTSGQSPTITNAGTLTPTVTFNEDGVHTLRLTATNTNGDSVFDELTATVAAVDTTPPVVTNNGPATITIVVGGTYTPNFSTNEGSLVITGMPDTSTAGTYTVTATATDASGNVGSATQIVVVEEEVIPNQPPVANAGPNQSVAAGVSVQLDGTGSTDGDGTIVSYAWSQSAGDAVILTGATTVTPSLTAPSTNAAQTLTFDLTVTDNEGLTATDSVDIDVAAAASIIRPFIVEPSRNFNFIDQDGLWSDRLRVTETDSYTMTINPVWISPEEIVSYSVTPKEGLTVVADARQDNVIQVYLTASAVGRTSVRFDFETATRSDHVVVSLDVIA